MNSAKFCNIGKLKFSLSICNKVTRTTNDNIVYKERIKYKFLHIYEFILAKSEKMWYYMNNIHFRRTYYVINNTDIACHDNIYGGSYIHRICFCQKG